MKPNKNQSKQLLIDMIYNFFEKSSFTLRELCFIQLKLLQKLSYFESAKHEYHSLYQICQCYLFFIENDKRYCHFKGNELITLMDFSKVKTLEFGLWSES